MSISRRRFLTAAAALALASSGGAARADTPEARRVVETFHDKLLTVMKDARHLGFEGRVKELAPAIAAAFNLPLMARVSAGPAWANFSPDEQRQMTELFQRYSAATYASRFDDYDGERFETVGELPQPGDNVAIDTQMVVKAGDPVRLTYLMLHAQSTWRIVDVFANGAISQLAVLRSEFTSVAKRDGAAGLIQTLARKIDELKAKS
jgi:phospholipid transport system substrate-binding protein